MKRGDRVQVRKTLAYMGPFKPPIREWCSGYVVDVVNANVVRVRALEGAYEGMIINYPAKDVRPEVQS